MYINKNHIDINPPRIVVTHHKISGKLKEKIYSANEIENIESW
jgi:hypothetical protein